MWPVDVVDNAIRPSARFKGCLYCPRCDAHYTPNLEWGIATRERGDTSGRAHWSGVHRKGTECPVCGAQFDGCPADSIDGGN